MSSLYSMSQPWDAKLWSVLSSKPKAALLHFLGCLLLVSPSSLGEQCSFCSPAEGLSSAPFPTSSTQPFPGSFTSSFSRATTGPFLDPCSWRISLQPPPMRTGSYVSQSACPHVLFSQSCDRSKQENQVQS